MKRNNAWKRNGHDQKKTLNIQHPQKTKKKEIMERSAVLETTAADKEKSSSPILRKQRKTMENQHPLHFKQHKANQQNQRKDEITDAEKTQKNVVTLLDDGSKLSNDPYMFKESSISYSIPEGNRWTNKQRTLVFCTRGVTHRHRHLMEDIKLMLPHSKSEAKWEKKGPLTDINEVCEMQSCNNCLLFENRKNSELYMWMARVPNGPSVKFQVLNIHTLDELKMSGNCLLHSRPLLVFSQSFDDKIELNVLKELFIQTFGTPRNHPKSKPFFDHVMSFVFFDNKIFFRHYQISPMTEKDHNKPERQLLIEIGPRFVLDLIKIFDGSFGGSTIYENPHYVTPSQLRLAATRGFGNRYASRKAMQNKHKMLVEQLKMPSDALDPKHIFSTLDTGDNDDTE